jgi:hypothetical protein
MHFIVLFAIIAKRGQRSMEASVSPLDEMIPRAGNSPVASKDPTAHAEINAIRQASALRNYRLEGESSVKEDTLCAMPTSIFWSTSRFFSSNLFIGQLCLRRGVHRERRPAPAHNVSISHYAESWVAC